MAQAQQKSQWIGKRYNLRAGDTIFIPAELPHAVNAAVDESVTFLAFGVPHKHVASTDRMKVVK